MKNPDLIRCPICPPEIACDHDQAERRELCRLRGETPELEPAPPVYDASSRRQVDKQKQVAKRDLASRDGDLIWLMGQPAGRRFMYALLERCGVFRATFNPQAPDALRLAHAEGQRNVGLIYLNDITRAAPREYLVMLQEKTADAA